MKKKILSLFIGVLGFFFFSCNKVLALPFVNQNINLDFDANTHFNFYYEFYHNTDFYKFIVSQGSGFQAYLKSFVSDGHDVFFAYTSDLDSTMQSHVLEDSYYTIIITGNYNRCYLYYDSGNYSFTCPSNAQYNHVTYLFYDVYANYLGSYDYQYNASLHLNLNTSYVSYIIGSYYGYLQNLDVSSIGWYNNGNNSNTTLTIRLSHLIIDNSQYRISDLDTVENIFDKFAYYFGGTIVSWFRSDLSFKDLNDYGLGFFTKNLVIGHRNSNYNRLVSIYMAFSYSDTFNYSVSVPSGYSNISFDYNNRYFLIPNSTTCSNAEHLLYFSTSDTSTINFVSYDLLLDELRSDSMKTYSFQLKLANSIEVLSLHSVVGSYENIIKNFYLISSSDNLSTNTMYYNPVCYSAYSAIDSNDLTFTNINTGNQVTITPAEKQLIIYNSNETIDNIIAESDLNLTDIISGAWNGSKTFISASYYILSMSTTLFTSLPNEVKGVLLCVFTVGMIVILWKVFRS